MRGWFLLFLCVVTTHAQELNTFGTGLSSQRLYLAEVSIDFIRLFLCYSENLMCFRLKFSISLFLLDQLSV
jgi:hypothetical protein